MSKKKIEFFQSNVDVLGSALWSMELYDFMESKCSKELKAIADALLKKLAPKPPVNIGDLIKDESCQTPYTKIRVRKIQVELVCVDDGKPKFVWWINTHVKWDSKEMKVIKK